MIRMNDQITETVIPILKAIQADIAVLKSDVAVLKTDVAMLKDCVRRIDGRMGTMESYMAGFHMNLHTHGVELNMHRERISVLEAKYRPLTSPPV